MAITTATQTAAHTTEHAAGATNSADTLTRRACAAAAQIGSAPTQLKNAALADFATRLHDNADAIIAANAQDLAAADDGNLAAPLRERLGFGQPQLAAAADGVMKIVAQDDPVGAIDNMRTMPSGIQVGQMRVPLGVLLMIYESRPNVTVDAAALALKAGNAALLRGGSEARHTNAAIADCLDMALQAHGLAHAAQVITDPSRELVGELLTRENEIDLVIPRGGKGLTARVAREARMAVLYHLDGNCHVYVDEHADIEMATAIVENAKTRRYGVCNAAESLLVHAGVAAEVLPRVAAALAPHGVELRACPVSLPLLQAAGANGAEGVNVQPATEEDWSLEYLAPIISVKVVDAIDEAIAHINHYGSAHSDAIVSRDIGNCRRFMREVDSSSVLVNASTGFADGGEYGLGAEIGIATGKLHARGPVGAVGLTTQKYIVLGDGQCRG